MAEKRGDEVDRGNETAAAAGDANGLFLAPILFIFTQLKQKPPSVTKIRPTRAISLQSLGPMAPQPS